MTPIQSFLAYCKKLNLVATIDQSRAYAFMDKEYGFSKEAYNVMVIVEAVESHGRSQWTFTADNITDEQLVEKLEIWRRKLEREAWSASGGV